ncbi:TetR/AcrR family transcriptional regulator C-terminal domain-containing protein [Sorangium atrum]|uniref:TetR/AcrR family transcriptional regulator C-terminal domain-containing protein n=1 Tax=Sorangium atrum TaxID=2995308 RepID=A0ABT5C8Q2_9BACT|nr:TetR/AcrR family transcriptional regulator C-terminal domain-containing protein [Sorangium aterium]MDC0682819.1 TetR/AcrR family transcriptional regulator C-terminal domain-containing protein [Sorangium aterium]
MRLRREQVVATALRLLNDVGLDALTMRRLGQELEVQAATLYWHIKNKEELLDAMAEAMLAGCAESVPVALSGMERAADMGERLRRALLAHRDGARVFAGTYVAQDNTLRVSEVLIGALSDAGLSPRAAAWGCWSIVYYVIGFALEEQALVVRPGADRGKADPALFREAVERGAYPHLAAALPHLLSADTDARFRYGLELILKGLEAELEAAPRPSESRSSPRAGAKKRAPRRSG